MRKQIWRKISWKCFDLDLVCLLCEHSSCHRFHWLCARCLLPGAPQPVWTSLKPPVSNWCLRQLRANSDLLLNPIFAAKWLFDAVGSKFPRNSQFYAEVFRRKDRHQIKRYYPELAFVPLLVDLSNLLLVTPLGIRWCCYWLAHKEQVFVKVKTHWDQDYSVTCWYSILFFLRLKCPALNESHQNIFLSFLRRGTPLFKSFLDVKSQPLPNWCFWIFWMLPVTGFETDVRVGRRCFVGEAARPLSPLLRDVLICLLIVYNVVLCTETKSQDGAREEWFPINRVDIYDIP